MLQHLIKLYNKKLIKIGELAIFLAAVATVLVLILTTNENSGPTFCLFNKLTHLLCFGCGITRATRALLTGNILAALRFNAFAFILIPFLIYISFCYFYWRFTGKVILHRSFYNSKVYIWVLVLLTIYTVLRNMPVYPFTLLAP